MSPQRLGQALLLCAILVPAHAARAPAQTEMVDTALVLAVDVSQSVTADRFALQKEGIAAAFEDPDVHRAILSGPRRAMLVALVQWSHQPAVTLPWRLVASPADAQAFAAEVRLVRRKSAEFTCMSRALRFIGEELLPVLPMPAARRVIDISSDGPDNCHIEPSVAQLRDTLVADGATINGLPILEGKDAGMLVQWYRDHVVGGPGAFIAPAYGYGDFERAMRRKIATEISRLPSEGE